MHSICVYNHYINKLYVARAQDLPWHTTTAQTTHMYVQYMCVQQCHTYEWVMSQCHTYEWVMSHTYERVMSHIWGSHVTHMLCVTWLCVTWALHTQVISSHSTGSAMRHSHCTGNPIYMYNHYKDNWHAVTAQNIPMIHCHYTDDSCVCTVYLCTTTT